MTKQKQIENALNPLQLEQARPTWSSYVLECAMQELPNEDIQDVDATLRGIYARLVGDGITQDRANLIKDLAVAMFTSNRQSYLQVDFQWLDQLLCADNVSEAQAYFAALAAPPSSLSAAAIINVLRVVNNSVVDDAVNSQISDELERDDVKAELNRCHPPIN
jgi:hypothetical protein